MEKAKKLPSGSWFCRVNYTDEEGKYKSKSFTAKAKKEVEAKAGAFLMVAEHAKLPENKTLDILATAYINNRSNVLSPSTIQGYDKIRRTALQSIVNVRLANLTKEMYQKAINDYSIGHSPKTVRSAHAFFNMLLKGNDIYIGEKVILPQKKKIEIEVPTTEEVSDFLQKIEGSTVYPMVLFATTLGLRRSEILGLKWKDIDRKKKTVHVERARVRNMEGEYVEKTTKTTESNRILQMPQILIDSLSEEGEREDYIFPVQPNGLINAYDRACERYNFHHSLHTLRHYCASVMLQQGIPNKYASEFMGHSTENMLQRVYQHTFKDAKEEYGKQLNNQMDNLFKPKEE